MTAAASIARWLDADDVRAAARARLPHGFFEFIDRGSEDEHALRNNREALQRIKLRTRVLHDVSRRSAATQLFGRTLAMPVVVAPTGPSGLVWYRGEVAMARAAAACGVPFTVSTASSTPLEAIRAEGGGTQWFQLYMWPDRAMSHSVVDRARAAGYDALVVTVDSIVPTQRAFNVRNGFDMPLRLNRRNGWDVLTHPRWLFGVMGRYMATTGMPRYVNYPGEVRARLLALPKAVAMSKNDSLVWDDLRHLRDRWPGKLLVKGIAHPEDARHAADCGADGVIVSNHGAVVFDSAAAPIDLLADVVREVNGRMVVIVDSGFRRGSDVVKALALGADAVMLGRAPLYGLAAGGQAGAERALSLIHAEIMRTLAAMGCASIQELGPDAIFREMA